MLKRILLGLAGTSYSASSTQLAIELAKRHDAELTGVTVFDLDRLMDVGPVPARAMAAAEDLREHRIHQARLEVRKSVDVFLAEASRAGVRHAIDYEKGDTFGLLVSLARYHDLIVLGVKGLDELDHLGHDAGATLAKLVSAGVRPILTSSGQHRPLKRILVSYSGSMESAKAMKRFAELDLVTNPIIRVVTFEPAHEDGARLVSQAANYFRAHGVEVQTDVVRKDPQHGLVAYAKEWNADLIVLGNSAKSLWIRRLFGETALAVMNHSDIPLFLGQ